jgi:hypothetical protein
VRAWCEYHAPGGPADAAREEEVRAWDSEFVKVDHGTLFEIILIANQLDIKELLDLTCLTVANMMKGASATEPRGRGPRLTRARARAQARARKRFAASSTSGTTSRRKRRRKSAVKISGRSSEDRR